MFEYLKGKVFINDNDSSIVVECGGVGYLLNCSLNTIAELRGKEDATVYTYMSVSDNGISLYGFAGKMEREVFLSLITVPKVGARSAVQILSLDTPGNMSINYDIEKLKWIETGAEPTFLLTEEMSEKFKDSKVENAFSTEMINWLDDVAKITAEFNTKLAFTGNCTIVEHTKLQSDVYRITYSNGNKVYVNYTNKQATVDNVTVKAVDYTVVTADGKTVA